MLLRLALFERGESPTTAGADARRPLRSSGSMLMLGFEERLGWESHEAEPQSKKHPRPLAPALSRQRRCPSNDRPPPVSFIMDADHEFEALQYARHPAAARSPAAPTWITVPMPEVLTSFARALSLLSNLQGPQCPDRPAA